ILLPYAPGNCFISVDGTSFATPLMTSLLAAHLTLISSDEAICIVGEDAFPVYQHVGSGHETNIFEALLEDSAGDCVDFVSLGNWLARHSALSGQEDGNKDVGSVSPNPFINSLVVELPENGAELNRVGLYDQNTGRRIFFVQTSDSQVTINTFDLQPGLYFVKITNSHGQYIHHVYKQG
ncbi:MAG: T9SS type A sorting domain-containing protein, partial [Bacteroidota bacterium]